MGIRIAARADIHGNADALADLGAKGADAVVILGDHFSSPLDAAGTWALLRGLDAQALRGN
jgi:predicted phosphodiesterase